MEVSMIRIPLGALAVALLVGVEPSLPAEPTPKPAAPPDCTAPEHRQFDFWLGTWDVMQNDKPAGVNRITSDLKGCVLVEQWTAASGGRGTSLNFYDRNDRSWHQTWIDQQGGALRLKGGLRGAHMVLESAPAPDAKGVPTVQRITWSPRSGGGLRQHWESSADGGKTWTTAFDGLYVRKP
jgi:hypothetical protein